MLIFIIYNYIAIQPYYLKAKFAPRTAEKMFRVKLYGVGGFCGTGARGVGGSKQTCKKRKGP